MMPTAKQYYDKLRFDLHMVAQDRGGVVLRRDLEVLVAEHIGCDRRTLKNVERALTLIGKLKPVNQHSYLLCDGEDTE